MNGSLGTSQHKRSALTAVDLAVSLINSYAFLYFYLDKSLMNRTEESEQYNFFQNSNLCWCNKYGSVWQNIRVARFVMQDHSRFTISLLLKDLNWAPLKDRRQDIRLAMLLKIVNCNMPVQADAILLPTDPTTRHHHSFKFKHILSYTAQYKHSFFVRTVPEWNSLPEACVNADTVTAFQTQLRHSPWAVCTPPSSWYAKVVWRLLWTITRAV